VDDCCVSVVAATIGVLGKSMANDRVGSTGQLVLVCIGSVWTRLLVIPSYIAGDALMRKVTSRSPAMKNKSILCIKKG